MKKNILVASESRSLHPIVEALFAGQYATYAAGTTDEALELIQTRTIHLIICARKLRDGDCFSLMERVRGLDRRYSSVPALILSNAMSSDLVVRSHKYDISDIVKLPFEPLGFDLKVHDILVRNARGYEKPDPVTGLHKKQYAEEQIIELLADGKKGALFLIDLDRYSFASSGISKEALIACRDILKKTISPEAVLSVVSGGGFMLFVPGMRSRGEIETYADTLITAVLTKINSETLYVSIGLALTDRHGSNYHDLYLMCDKGLNRARTAGKNMARFYHW